LQRLLAQVISCSFLSENLYSEYHKELQDSFAVSYEQLQFILDSLLVSIDTGQTQKVWEKIILTNGINLPKDLPETFFRTITSACYCAGRWQRFESNKKFHPYLMYDAINDSRVRKNHLAMDGIIRPIDDIFWKTHSPPNGINCRCRLVSLNERQAQARSLPGNEQKYYGAPGTEPPRTNTGNGLNKFITCKMKPDEGWDFNVGEDLLAFMKIGVLGLAKINAEYSAC
jgi:SPP1 gp7 family putative phage head morphogenesis protein